MTLRMIAALALAFLATSNQAFGAYVTVQGVHPARPRAFELVTLRYTANFCSPGGKARVERAGSDFVVIMLREIEAVICPATVPYAPYEVEVRLGSFPPGSYFVDVVEEAGAPLGHPVVDPQRFGFIVDAPASQPPTFPPARRPQYQFTGHRWNQSESGWGLAVHQSASEQMFVVLFQYDASGRAAWLVAPGGRWYSSWGWEATLYRATGPQFIGAVFDPRQVERTAAGSLRLEFVGYALRVGTEEYPRVGQARLTYEVDGVRVTKVIERLPF